MDSHKRGVSGFKPENKMQNSETKPDEENSRGDVSEVEKSLD